MENAIIETAAPIYTLRPYQLKLIEKIESAWQSRRRIMLQLATGGGKTVIFAYLARKFAEQGQGVLVLAHREELILQAQEKLEAVAGVPVGVIKAGFPTHPYELQVASVQTLIRRKNKPEADLIIVDEVHHAVSKTYTTILEFYPNAKILGCTATPCRIDGQGFQWLFDELICGPSAAALMDGLRGDDEDWGEDGKYLSGYRLFSTTKTVDTSKTKTTNGDFNPNALTKAVGAQIEPCDVVGEWKKHAQGLRTVVFAVDVLRSQQYAQEFQNEGILSEHLDGKTAKDERKNILNRFTNGEIQVLCNCGIVSEGFDLPAIECVQVVRPTKSTSMWLQMLGRGLRIMPGKKYAVFIDHTQNRRYLGGPEDYRRGAWSLHPIPLDEEDKRFFYLECQKCQHSYRPLPHEMKKLISFCPNCLAENRFELGSGGPGQSKDLTANVDSKIYCFGLSDFVPLELRELIDRLFQVAIEQKLKPVWVYYRFKHELNEQTVLHTVSLATWRYLAEKLGYPKEWAWKELHLATGKGLTPDETELVEMMWQPILNQDSSLAKTIQPILTEVCDKGKADRRKVWQALSPDEQKIFTELLQSNL